MTKLGALTAVCLLSVSGAALAGEFGAPSGPNMAYSGFFGGLGGSYDSINFGNQNVYAVGTSNTYSGGVLVATGSAAGPATLPMPSQSTFAPTAQGGYFQHFTASDWLWGTKFSYSYLGASAATPNVLLPQAGSFNSGGTTTPFTGNALVSSYQAAINQQLSMMLFVGRAFGPGFFYLGAGPTVAQTQTNLYAVTGFADINGAHTQITGTPTNLSSSGWIGGGAVQLGATYFLDRSWFLDFNYTYSMTANQSLSYEAPFTNASMTEIGTLSGTSSARVITQAVSLSLNKAFYLDVR